MQTEDDLTVGARSKHRDTLFCRDKEKDLVRARNGPALAAIGFRASPPESQKSLFFGAK